MHAESSIGAWQLCLEMIGVVACLTNLLLAVLISKHVDLYVPASMADHLGSFEAKVRFEGLHDAKIYAVLGHDCTPLGWAGASLWLVACKPARPLCVSIWRRG